MSIPYKNKINKFYYFLFYKIMSAYCSLIIFILFHYFYILNIKIR